MVVLFIIHSGYDIDTDEEMNFVVSNLTNSTYWAFKFVLSVPVKWPLLI